MLETLVIATGNRDKLVEMTARLDRLVRQVLSVRDFPGFVMPPETGTTLAENALIKARALQQETQHPVLADDTGLFVDALDGAPGVWSARYAGVDATYADNVRKLLQQLERVPTEQRTASFMTTMALVWSEGEHLFEGAVPGHILKEPDAGGAGFGYDPVFQPAGEDRPYSAMSLEQKNRLSHRGRALTALTHWIQEHLDIGA